MGQTLAKFQLPFCWQPNACGEGTSEQGRGKHFMWKTFWLTDCLVVCLSVLMSALLAVCVSWNQLKQSDVSDSQSSKVPLNVLVASAVPATPPYPRRPVSKPTLKHLPKYFQCPTVVGFTFCMWVCVCVYKRECVWNEDWQLNVFTLTSSRLFCWLISPRSPKGGHSFKCFKWQHANVASSATISKLNELFHSSFGWT